MKKRNYIVLTGLLFSLLFIAACNSESENMAAENNDESDNPLKIYTTLYPLEDFTKKIGGEFVEVESIMPLGADAHTFEPTSKQMVDIAGADAFIYNGMGMESYAESMSSALESEDVALIEAAEGIETVEHSHEHDHEGDEESTHEHDHESEDATTEEHDHESEDATTEEHDHEDEDATHDHNHGDMDPHVWLDPIRAIALAENIKDQLVELKPEEEETFEANFETLKADLENLDTDFHNLIDSKENPEMIVSHAAYGYWEDNYGVVQIPIAGLSSSEEPSQKELTEVISVAKEKDLKYVIFEQNVTTKVAEVIRNEIGAEPLQLHNLSVLTEEDAENDEDYFSLMERNLETLNKALQ
ncbi:putative zinc transport system zinc-binding lipoprotein AdcA precursor [Oceanobacillus picturae]|uniref:Zinc transport system zinc-binding lipoprotein AdcA n=1 Tax=Oceanobacillus picturae TaxID=171693 RepID=W9APV6_9BACI|nr:zinc ABC transporter substrate-binding protein [Oceanobacillus picturae]CDO04641.1 putative zinc transport system zinc-binding lipoprotein AdcA precursor [Oceanobacillus picturae]